MHLLQFTNRHSRNIGKSRYPPSVKQQFGIRVTEALNHVVIVTSFDTNVKCYVFKYS